MLLVIALLKAPWPAAVARWMVGILAGPVEKGREGVCDQEVTQMQTKIIFAVEFVKKISLFRFWFLCSFVGGSSSARCMRSRKTGQQMHNPLTARQGCIFPFRLTYAELDLSSRWFLKVWEKPWKNRPYEKSKT